MILDDPDNPLSTGHEGGDDESLMHKAEHGMEDVKDKASDMMDDAGDTMNRAKEDAEDAMDDDDNSPT